MFFWLFDVVQKAFGPPAGQVITNDEGIEVRQRDKIERVAWDEIDEVWGERFFRRDFFLVLAGSRKIAVGWPDRGVAEAIRVMEVKLPGFAGTWSDMMDSEAPGEAILWRKPGARSRNEVING